MCASQKFQSISIDAKFEKKEIDDDLDKRDNDSKKRNYISHLIFRVQKSSKKSRRIRTTQITQRNGKLF